MSAIDNLRIDKSKLETYMLSPLSNGLTDHEAQLLEIHYTLYQFRTKLHGVSP
jgi:hypothetical protein